jgi:Tol biopolymer transport system component
MVQMNKMTDGFGKSVWQVLLGDIGSALFSGLYVPMWFIEGDAVVMETALTKGGRGRTPYFNIWQRGLELSGETRYSYYKSYLGSYDALAPYADHYRLGYILSSYIRKHYGKEVWDRVLSDTGRYFLWYTFDRALTRATKRSIIELYDAALDEYKLLWEKQTDGIRITEADTVIPLGKSFTLPSVSMDYKYWNILPYPSFSASSAKWESSLFPAVSGDGDITAVKFSGDKKIFLIKLQNNNKITNIKQLPGEVISDFLMNERSFTTGGNFALWREGVPDPRWGYRSYSNLKLLNINTGESTYITDKKKYIASALSGNGKIAAGIEYGTDLKYRLSIIDTLTKEEKFREVIKDQGYLFDPAISPDGKDIALAALADNGNAILIYNLETKQIRTVVGYTNNERLKAPVFYRKYLIYGSDYSGIDNIYAVDLTNGKRFQITSRPLGAYFPAVSGDRLYFNDYSVNGYHASTMKIDIKNWTPIEETDKRVIDYIAQIVDQELHGDNNAIDNIPDKEYKVENYYPVLNSINFFGWLPYFDSTSSEFFLSILSRDVLHTTDLIFSYIHNFNEKTDTGRISITYSGFYPVITLRGGYGERAVYLQDESTKDDPVYLTWNEVTGFGAVSFPLNFSRGINTTTLNFGSGTGYIKVQDKNRYDYSIYNGIVNDGELQYINYFISLRYMNQTAMNSVSPGTGGVFNLSYVHTPYYGDYRGSLLSSKLALHLPGLTEMHGLKISGTYEKNKSSNYIFPQKFLFPRGYESLTHEQFFKGTVDYNFPILNFSAHIWKILYFKRINGALFYDFGAGNNSGYTAAKERREFIYYRSAGYEITAEQNWLSNKYLAIELGLRYSRCFDADEDAAINKDKNRYDLVLKTPI